MHTTELGDTWLKSNEEARNIKICTSTRKCFILIVALLATGFLGALNISEVIMLRKKLSPMTDFVFDTALIQDFPHERPSQSEWIGFINDTKYLCSHGRRFHLSRGEKILTICENGEDLYLVVNMCSTGIYLNSNEWKQLTNFVNSYSPNGTTSCRQK